MISVTCSCRGEFWVRDRLAGREANCPSCGKGLAVPALDAVRAKMTPAPCSCGEVFWSSAWQQGKLSRCPICGDAVGPNRSKGGAASVETPGTKKGVGDSPAPRSTSSSSWETQAAPTSASGVVGIPRGSGVRAPGGRLSFAGAGMGRKPIALAAAAVVLLAVALFAAVRALGPGPEAGLIASGPAPQDQDPPQAPATGEANPAGGGPTPSAATDEAGGSGNPTAVAETAGTATPDAATPPAAPPPVPISTPMKILVPAYFYPAGPDLKHWDRMIDAAKRVPIVVVANPSSGPGEAPNSDYVNVVKRASRGKAEVIGYVHTDYANRPREQIEADVDRWFKFYPEIRGIFFDAQSPDAKDVPLYRALRDYVRRKRPNAPLVVTNPGAIFAEDYLKQSATDVAVLFEHPGDAGGFKLPPWAGSYQSTRLAAIPYAVESADRMREIVRQAADGGIGHLYVTDGPTGNAWTRLPGYWDEEVEAVRRLNEERFPGG